MTAKITTTHRWSQPRDLQHGSADQSCCPELTPASVRSSNSTPDITCMSKFGRSSIFINSPSETSVATRLVDRPQSHLFYFFCSFSKPKLPNDLMSVFQLSERPCKKHSGAQQICEIFKNTLNVQKRVYCVIRCVLYDVHGYFRYDSDDMTEHILFCM